MGNLKHIDRLFQEQFKDFEEAPNPKLWEQLKTKLKDNFESRQKLSLATLRNKH
jgi:hypothetical protein